MRLASLTRATQLVIFAAGCLQSSCGSASVDKDLAEFSTPDEIAPIHSPFPMAQLKLPVFPGHTESIVTHGAIGDGKSMNSRSFAAAIQACSAAGGGRVLVPAGRWLTGPIHLKSNINLHLEKGAEILFSTNWGDYLPAVFTRNEGVESYSYSPLIYAIDCNNIAITGPGMLIGQGEAWWSWRRQQRTTSSQAYEMALAQVPVERRLFDTPDNGLRPSFIQTIRCTHVLLDGFTITSGPMWTIHPVYSENVIIRNITEKTRGLNNDGIDIDSSRNVLVEQCQFDTSDDAIAIKSGLNEDGWRVGRPSENIVVRRCRFGLGRRNDSVVSIGSDMSGDVRNVHIYECEFDQTERGVRIKSMRGRGGIVENVWIENIKMGRIDEEPILLDMFYDGSFVTPRTQKTPRFRGIHIRNVKCDEVYYALRVIGLPESPIEDVTIENYEVTSQKGVVCKEVSGLVLSGVRIRSSKPPLMVLENARDVIIRDSPWTHELVPFLWLKGRQTKNIQLVHVDLPHPERQLVMTKDVPAGVIESRAQ